MEVFKISVSILHFGVCIMKQVKSGIHLQLEGRGFLTMYDTNEKLFSETIQERYQLNISPRNTETYYYTK